jgi:hydrogenase maturation factor
MSEPGLVVSVTDGMALVAIRGILREVPLTVLADLAVDVLPGDTVLMHCGLAVAVLTPQEAAQRNAFLHEGAPHEGP